MRKLNVSELQQVSGGVAPLIPIIGQFAARAAGAVVGNYVYDTLTTTTRGVLVRNPNSPWSKFRKRK